MEVVGGDGEEPDLNDEDDFDDDDSDDSDAPRRKKGKGGRKGAKYVERRSDRSGAGGRSMYKEPSDDDDDLCDSDEEAAALAARRRAAPESFAPEPVQSVYEKLLSQREAASGAASSDPRDMAQPRCCLLCGRQHLLCDTRERASLRRSALFAGARRACRPAGGETERRRPDKSASVLFPR